MAHTIHSTLAKAAGEVLSIAKRLVKREKDCDAHPNLCEKPINTKKMMGISIGVSALALICGGLMAMLFFRRLYKRRERAEDAAVPEVIDEDDRAPILGGLTKEVKKWWWRWKRS